MNELNWQDELDVAVEQTNDLLSLFPATTTRAETALSRYPIHNLSKSSETIAIHLNRKGESSDADIQWKVSPSQEYGGPRQLAYKIDTLVVNRRIDETGRPVPRLIRLGSLRQICHELGLVASGENTSGIRHALLQNASAFITAKLTYRAADGSVKKFEAGFSRYSVVFAGEELPNGHVADAVHILLNEHYWKLLNKAQFRPLDYAYQKSLSPSAHRFYELVSFAIFACLQRRQREAKLLYSDYCLRAPQPRYTDRAKVQKQMYKLHQPHIESEYISKVRYEKVLDREGNPDWEIFYTPGRRAKAHFLFFGKNRADSIGEEVAVHSLSKGQSQPRPARKTRTGKPSLEGASPLSAALQERGVSAKVASALARDCQNEQASLDAIQWGDHLINQAKPGEIRNPAGFYVYLVREKIAPPPAFSGAQRIAHEAEEKERLRSAYEEYQEKATLAYIQANAAEQFEAERARALNELRSEFKNMEPELLSNLATRTTIAEFRKVAGLMTFDQFCQQSVQSQPSLFSSRQV
jgi:hypothetical protein